MKNLTILLLAITFFACKKSGSTPTPTPTVISVAEKIKKSWTANQVTEAGTVVYTKAGATNTKPAYSKFKLDLSNASSATLTEFDGNSFTGTWEVVSDKTLILKGLTPQPTGTAGTIEYAITEATTAVLKLNRTTANAKTGGAAVSYILD
jgi:hypothetical protein